MAIHQFAHGGDLHLGPNARNADRRKAFDQYVNAGVNLTHLAAWLVPGDLNHGRMTIDDRNYLASRFCRMAAAAPVVIVPGNHDLPGDLDIFAQLNTSYPISIVTTPRCISIRTATGAKATIFCLPYPTEAGLVAKGVAPGDLGGAAREELQKIFLHAAGELAAARLNGDLVLAIGHVNVAGSMTAAGQPNIGREIEIDGSMIAMLGASYVGLNHIHVAQDIGGAFYPGSFCRLDWAEIHPKGWLRVDAEIDGPTAVWSVITVPLDVAPMWHVEGELTRDGFTWAVKDGPDGSDIGGPLTWAGSEVRVRARFNANERDLLDKQDWSEWRDALRFELELIAVPNRELRAPAVAAAKTLHHKVKAWADVSGVVATESVLKKLATIEFAGEEELTRALDEHLADLVGPREKVTVAA